MPATPLNSKANKVQNGTIGDVVVLSSTGDLADSDMALDELLALAGGTMAGDLSLGGNNLWVDGGNSVGFIFDGVNGVIFNGFQLALNGAQLAPDGNSNWQTDGSGNWTFNFSSAEFTGRAEFDSAIFSNPIDLTGATITGPFIINLGSLFLGNTLGPVIGSGGAFASANASTVATMTIAAPSGTASDGIWLPIRIHNTNTGSTTMTLAFNAIYSMGGFTIGTIAAGKTAVFLFWYSATTSKWILISYNNGA